MSAFDLHKLLRMDGRVAVVVGGAGNLGSVICEALASEGATIALIDKESGLSESLRARLERQQDATVSMHEVDLEQLDDADGLFREIVSFHGRIDVLVHAASLVGTSPLPGWTTPFEEQSLTTWRRALEVNLTSVFSTVQAFARQERLLPRSSHAASVVLIGSIYGSRGVDLSLYTDTAMGNPAAYAASKGGVGQFTRWAATVLAPRIRVNCVSPGGILRNQPSVFIERYVSRTPLGRLATEADVAATVAFLASPAAAYITGQEILVDGGFSLR